MTLGQPSTTSNPSDYATGYHDGVKAAIRVLEESATAAISKRPQDSVGYVLRANVKIIEELRWPGPPARREGDGT